MLWLNSNKRKDFLIHGLRNFIIPAFVLTIKHIRIYLIIPRGFWIIYQQNVWRRKLVNSKDTGLCGENYRVEFYEKLTMIPVAIFKSCATSHSPLIILTTLSSVKVSHLVLELTQANLLMCYHKDYLQNNRLCIKGYNLNSSNKSNYLGVCGNVR